MPILDPINTDQTENNELTTVGVHQRNVLFPKNDYSQTNNYGPTHPDAMADGDDKGRGTGEFLDVDNEDAGTSIDKAERINQTVINFFGPNNTYPNF